MAAQICSLWLLLVSVFVNPPLPAAKELQENTFGNAEIIQVSQITPDFILICDIRDFPPVIGQAMPVRIRGLEVPQSMSDPELRSFLVNLFMQNQNDPNHLVLLKNIQRGDSFCLIADISVNGCDLGDHLVREGLVKRILKISSTQQETDVPTSVLMPSQSPALQIQQPVTKPAAPKPPQPQGFVASRSSKIFHRADCPHARRIAEDKKVYFPTREQAIASGRKPCKTCGP